MSSSSHELNQTKLMNEPIVVVSSDGSEQVCVCGFPNESSVSPLHLKINYVVSI